MDTSSAGLEIWRGLLYGQKSMVNRLMAQVKKDFGLTVPQYEALLFLAESPDEKLSASDLAAGLLYSSGSTSHLVTRLEELGYVQRTSVAGDSRKVDVAITAAGSELIREATRAHVADLRREFLPLINSDNAAVLLEFARKFAASEQRTSQPWGI